MSKKVEPLYIHYFDNQSATLYNLTKDQFNKLLEEDDGIDLTDKFQIEFDEFTVGYVPPEVEKLAELYGFEVGIE